MATIRQIKAAAEKLGAEVSPGEYDVYVYAPHRSVWNCDDIHLLVANVKSWYRGPNYRAEALDDLLSRMQLGVSPCTRQGCTYCADQEESE